MPNRHHIDRIGSLKKEDFFSPFVITWTEPYGTEAHETPIQDVRNEGAPAGARLKDLLDRLLPMIDQYPYEWSLSGQSIDAEGYDLIVNPNHGELELPVVAHKEALRKLGIPPIEQDITNPYREGERVYAPHLTKLQLTLEKASPLSTLSFQFFSKNPVTLLSLVSERDLAGNAIPETINLKQVQYQQSDDTITLLFGTPVFAKRLTFVLGQDAASSNTYYVRQYGEDFNYAPTDDDRMRLIDFVSHYHHGTSFATDEILSDLDIKDWSPERRAAYEKWRNTVQRGEG